MGLTPIIVQKIFVIVVQPGSSEALLTQGDLYDS
ncbi:hypothetical protein J2W17_002269 [Pseudomonas lini]|jgi:hypothetical protein|nr:hypothetical protein [Pseudomonas lini]